MGNVPGQVISELGEIGKAVAGEAAKVPKDVAGKALESLGASGGAKGKGQQGASVWEKIDTEPDLKIRRALARKALEELSGSRIKQKEPSIWDRLQMEAQQKKQEQQQRVAATAASDLPMPAAKRPRGDLYGIKAKKTAAENRNVRQD